MINYDSILSAFDGKPTLLQWLKMVKKALDESILKNINITQNGQKVVFTFNFEDGTSISTPEVTLPKGDKGDKGDKGADIVRIETTGSAVVGVNTESTIRVELSDGSIKQFKTYAKNGSDGVNGNDGVSITGISTVGNQVVGDETLTTIRANYSDQTSDEFIVRAKNGGFVNLYLHSVKITDTDNYYNIYFNIYSRKENLNLEDALKYIPTSEDNSYLGKNKVNVCLDYGTNVGSMCAIKYRKDNGYNINLRGVLRNSSDGSSYTLNLTFEPKFFTDTLLGENL